MQNGLICIRTAEGGTDEAKRSGWNGGAVRSFPAVHPFPEKPHEGAPHKEEGVVDPFGDGCGVRRAVGEVLDCRVVGIEVGAGAEIVVGAEAQAVSHYIEGQT